MGALGETTAAVTGPGLRAVLRAIIPAPTSPAARPTTPAAASARRARIECPVARSHAQAARWRPSSQTTRLEASGKATCWQGYIARLGFGITRNRNQARAASDISG